MQCPFKSAQGPELFVSYAAGSLAPEIEAALEQHLTVCSDCRAIGGAQKAVWSALDTWRPGSISSDFDSKVFARIAAEGQTPWYRRPLKLDLFSRAWPFDPGVRHAMPVGAACAALLAAVLLRGPLPDRKQDTASVRQVDIEQVERALDDIDMLKQLGIVPASGDRSSGQESL